MLRELQILMYAVPTTAQPSATSGGFNEARAEAHKFMSKNISEAVYEKDALAEDFDSIVHPKNQGKSGTIQKYEKYDAKITEYKAGADIPMDAPQAIVEIDYTLKAWAGWGRMNEDEEIYDLSNGKLDRKSTQQGKSLGEKLSVLKYRAELSSKNKYYAGVDFSASGAPTTHANALKAVGKFDIADLSKIRAFFSRMGVEAFKGDKYLMRITPEITAQLMSLAKDDDNFTFVELLARTQNGERLFKGQVGDMFGFVFVETNVITDIEEKGVVGCVILGKVEDEKGMVEIELEGKSGIESVLHPRGTIASDPLDTYGTYGWKKWGTYAVRHPEAVMIYYCKADVIGAGKKAYQDSNVAMTTTMPITAEQKANAEGTAVEYSTSVTQPSGKVNLKDKNLA